jgi:hypothetical protein
LRNIAKRFEVSPTAVYRHKEHVPVDVQQALRGEKIAAELPVKKQHYLEGLVAGKSKRAAALAAGFSESMASHAATKIETADVKAAFARLVREAVPAEKITEVIVKGLVATDTKVLKDGTKVPNVLNVAALAERRACAQLAAELGGYATPESKEERGGGGVILLFGGAKPEDPENRTVEAAPEEKQGPILLLRDTPKQEPQEGNE